MEDKQHSGRGGRARPGLAEPLGLTGPQPTGSLTPTRTPRLGSCAQVRCPLTSGARGQARGCLARPADENQRQQVGSCSWAGWILEVHKVRCVTSLSNSPQGALRSTGREPAACGSFPSSLSPHLGIQLPFRIPPTTSSGGLTPCPLGERQTAQAQPGTSSLSTYYGHTPQTRTFLGL